jgi:hypothetical protein
MILAGNRAGAEKESGERRKRAEKESGERETEREIVKLEIKHIKNLPYVK